MNGYGSDNVMRRACSLIASAFVLAGIASYARAWPGHDWDAWRQVKTWTRSHTTTPQSGRKELVPLLGPGPDVPGGITTIAEWEGRAREYAGVISNVLGTMNAAATQPSSESAGKHPQVQSLGEEVLDDHIRRHIRIRTEVDDWIPAYLLIPKQPAEPRMPAMICLHQTVAQGKDEPCGIKGDPELAFALQLVRRGFICLAPDAIGFGERIPAGQQPYHDSMAFYRRHPAWSFMGKMNWDVSRVVDYLRTLPEVDPLQIGCIGHSHGAYGSLFAAAFEPRISLVIASCGFTTFRTDPQPDRWSHLTALIPQLGIYLPKVEDIPFDWQDICALIAPRPLYVWYATKDSIFPKTDNLDALFKDVRNIYGLYGAADDLAWKAFDGPHKFPQEGRSIAYHWLDERLFPTGDFHSIPKDVKTWEKQRDQIRRVIHRTIGMPDKNVPPLNVTTLSTEQFPDYRRQLIQYTVPDRERVKAYLCIPRNRDQPRPAILVLHQTTREGKRESVGIAGDASLAFASELADRGYVTLAPDSITAGERIDLNLPFDTREHYRRHPDFSAMGKMLEDARIALDILINTEGVDAQRIGSIGHSLGAEESLFIAAFDERIRVCVASCGYETMRSDTRPTRWARDAWFSYMPKLRPVLTRGDLPAWDWDDAVRLIAPRALYQFNTRDDKIFPESESAYESAEVSRTVWQLYDRQDQLVNVLRPGKHGIDPDSKREVYEWLDRQLHP